MKALSLAAIAAAVLVAAGAVGSATAQPVAGSPLSAASSSGLTTPGAIRGLAADGLRVAVTSDPAPGICRGIAVWSPGAEPLPIGPQSLCPDPEIYFNPWVTGPIALAGTQVAWTEGLFAHDVRGHVVMTASTTDPDVLTALGVADVMSRPHFDLGAVQGRGDLLVFNTWRECADDLCDLEGPTGTGAIRNQQLWRIVAGKRVALRSGRGSVYAQSVDRGRIATLEPGGAVDVLAGSGKLAHRLALRPGVALAAKLGGRRLVVQTQAGLRVYRAADGKLLRIWRLPRSKQRVLADLDGGLAVYVDGRTVHVLRIADGKQTAFAPPGTGPVFAQLEPGGLFTGYSLTAGPDLGHVDFLTHAQLIRRLRS